jgi:hypothetical protein
VASPWAQGGVGATSRPWCPLPPRLPTLLRLRPAWLDRKDAIERHVEVLLRPRPCWRAWVAHVFALHEPERAFARALLSRRTGWWVLRSHQQRSCGDFLVVDPSAPRPDGRRVWVVELKSGAPLREGGGGAGIQLSRSDEAVAELVSAGVLGPRVVATRLTGDGELLLRRLSGLPDDDGCLL